MEGSADCYPESIHLNGIAYSIREAVEPNEFDRLIRQQFNIARNRPILEQMSPVPG
ncbi:MAG: hypothetical protein MUF72_04365 [Elainella sp. Prado103]|jgi:hypothetical protein|nr:hypothetical protein [Elainella sp. Prado103]